MECVVVVVAAEAVIRELGSDSFLYEDCLAGFGRGSMVQ